jgi:N-acetyl sugar amidotransferase
MNIKRKNLILLTSSFPCGNDEVFLENEYPFLLDSFDRIVIITSSNLPVRKEFVHPKLEVVRINKSVSIFEKIVALFPIIFSSIYSKEIRLIQRELQLPINRIVNRTLISACILQRKISKFISRQLEIYKFEYNSTTLYSYWFDEFAYAIACLKKSNPELMTISRAHGWDVYFERHPNNYLPLRKFTIENLDQCLVVSDFGVQYLKTKFKGLDSKVSCSRLGTPMFPVANPIQSDSHFHLVSCSSIIQLKRIDRIIHALKLLGDKSIHWTHFGSGILEDKMKEEARINLSNLPNITWEFKGNLSNSELIQFYQKTKVDLFINTSETEGIPVSIMEALSCSIPCMAPNVGGISEIVNEQVGHLLSSTPNELEISTTIRNFIEKDYETKTLMKNQAKELHAQLYCSKTNFSKFVSDISGKFYLQSLQSCKRCLFDNHLYPAISFDSKGICNICRIYEDLQARTVLKGAAGAQKLSSLINDIKSTGKNKPYDCIVGVSGGADSSYVAYLSKEWGLRPYIIHVDGGWNSDVSVKNILKLLRKLNLELHTHVIDWQEMRDLQRAFIKASVLDIDLPFDNAFMAILYKTASKLGIKYILSGHNTETEGWMPENFTHYKLDSINIKSIHQKYGEISMKKFPIIGPIDSWYYRKMKKIKMLSPLDLIDYNKTEVKEFLIKDFEWIDYGGKHYENLFTRFYQSYILLHKFKIDKRISHLSTLINSGQITKEQAKKELSVLPYAIEQIENEKEFFAKKLGFTMVEMEKYLSEPAIPHENYGSYLNVFKRLKEIRDFVLLK